MDKYIKKANQWYDLLKIGVFCNIFSSEKCKIPYGFSILCQIFSKNMDILILY